jgi:hypothetical protein
MLYTLHTKILVKWTTHADTGISLKVLTYVCVSSVFVLSSVVVSPQADPQPKEAYQFSINTILKH